MALSDEERLAELGYKQELNRSWSGFSNFAISFSIISILAGCFTTFAQAWNNGGPVAISIGWPVVSLLILVIGFCMSELASAYPTSGGIYWWASKLGGAKSGFFTGWLNLIGLVSVTASVGYGAASFLNTLLGMQWPSYASDFLGGDYIKQQFFVFMAIILLVTLINIYSGHLLSLFNNISVWWHVFGPSYCGGFMKALWRIIRAIFCGCLFAWIGVSMMETELEILTNSPFKEYMAHDIFYGYLSVRKFYENIVYVAIINFVMGLLIGLIWKPGSFKI